MKVMEAIRNAAQSLSQGDQPVSTTSTTWIPRAVRCPRCLELALEEVRERQGEDEIAVRYGCDNCRWQQVRHYLIGEG